VARIPDALDFVTAAALPTAGLTALQIIRDVVKARPGMTIPWRRRRRRFLCLADRQEYGRPRHRHSVRDDIDYLKSIGVDDVIDYKRERFEEKVSEPDAVVDLVGGETLARSYGVVRRGGILATTAEPIDESAAKRAGMHATHVVMRRNAADLAELARLAETGAVTPRLGQTMALSQAREAQELSERGRTPGKVILRVA
jgi:NADPH:quinone reductase-like Zn-dependent oxidoreductase